MVTLVIPNTCQIVAEHECSGQQVINVLHFTGTGGVMPGATAALTAFKNAWEKAGGPLKLKQPAVKMVGYKYTNLSSITGETGFLGSNTTGNGAISLSTMASSALLKFGGGTRSRSSAGRLYHGPLDEGQIGTDGRTMNITASQAIQLGYMTFLSDMAAAGLNLAVASRKNSTATNVASISVASVIATQRRRQR